MDAYGIADSDIKFGKMLAARFFRANFNAGIELVDVQSVALCALCEAARRFDRRKGVKFRTFAYLRVRGALFDFVRREKKRMHRYAPEQLGFKIIPPADSEDEIDVCDLDARSQEDYSEWLRFKKRLAVLLRRLPLSQREIVRLKYFRGLNYDEIAALLGGKSRTWVSLHHSRAIDDLRNSAAELRAAAPLRWM